MIRTLFPAVYLALSAASPGLAQALPAGWPAGAGGAAAERTLEQNRRVVLPSPAASLPPVPGPPAQAAAPADVRAAGGAPGRATVAAASPPRRPGGTSR